MSIRHISPALRIGQRTTTTREFQLLTSGHNSEPLDLTDAESVTLTLEHYEFGYTAINGGTCTITTPREGRVEYTFDQSETSLHGRYSVQFEVTRAGGITELVPPSSDEWVIDIGRRQPGRQPLSVPQIEADTGIIDDLQADRIDVRNAKIGKIINDPAVNDFSVTNFAAENANIAALTGPMDAGGNPIDNLGNPPSIRGAVTQEYVDTLFSDNYVTGLSNPLTADLDANNWNVLNPQHVGTQAAPGAEINFDRAYLGQTNNTVTVNPRVGDGTTDATVAFQNAITQAGPGGTIEVPKGTYRVDPNALVLDGDGQTLKGAGRGSTTIKLKAMVDVGDTYLPLLQVTGTSLDTLEDVTVKDLTLDWAKDEHTYVVGGQTSYAHEILDAKFCTNLLVENVTVQNTNSEGLDLDDTTQSQVIGVIADNCGGMGVHVSDGCSRVQVHDSLAVNCGNQQSRAGFDLFGGTPGASEALYTGLTAIDCYVGLEFGGPGATASGIVAYDCHSNGIRITGDGSYVSGAVQGTTGSAGNGVGVVINGASVLNAYVADTAGSGVYAAGSGGAHINAVIRRGDHGLSIGSGNVTFDVDIEGCAREGVTTSAGLTNITGLVRRANNCRRGVWLQTTDSTFYVLEARGNTNEQVRHLLTETTRTVVNGRSINGDDPRSAGDWFGHAGYATTLGLNVENTTTGTMYTAVGGAFQPLNVTETDSGTGTFSHLDLVTHDLGAAPSAIFLTPASVQATAAWHNRTATDFQIRLWDSAGNTLTTTTVSWFAIK